MNINNIDEAVRKGEIVTLMLHYDEITDLDDWRGVVNVLEKTDRVQMNRYKNMIKYFKNKIDNGEIAVSGDWMIANHCKGEK